MTADDILRYKMYMDVMRSLQRQEQKLDSITSDERKSFVKDFGANILGNVTTELGSWLLSRLIRRR